MDIDKTNKLMKAGLTEDQFEIVTDYIKEILLDKDRECNSLIQKVGRTDRIQERNMINRVIKFNASYSTPAWNNFKSVDEPKVCKTMSEFLKVAEESKCEKNKLFILNEVPYQLKCNGGGKSHMAEQFSKLDMMLFKSIPKVLDYNKFIEENSKLQTVKNFKNFVGKKL